MTIAAKISWEFFTDVYGVFRLLPIALFVLMVLFVLFKVFRYYRQMKS
jgi:hypothetical protein